MKPLARSLAITLLFTFMSGCTVLSSPASWEADTPKLDMGSLEIDSIYKKPDLTLDEVINQLVIPLELKLSSEKVDVDKTMNRASAGNYGWGILAAGAAIAEMHSSVLKGIALGAGTHVALSTRLSPDQQANIVNETIKQVMCVHQIALQEKSAWNAATTIATEVKRIQEPKYGKNLFANNGTATMGVLAEIIPADTAKNKNVDEYKKVVAAILFTQQTKMDGIYSNAMNKSSIATDLVASTNNLATALSANNADEKSKKGEVDKVVASNKGGVADSDKASLYSAVDAVKAANDISATIPTKLLGCQP